MQSNLNYSWRRFDRLTCSGANNLGPDDLCFYYMDKLQGGYEKSTANQLVFNLKKPMSLKGSAGWHYKGESIDRFGKDLARFVGTMKCRENLALVPMPPSSSRGSADYDDRILQACRIASRRTGIKVLDILDQKKSRAPFHISGAYRNIDEIQRNLKLDTTCKMHPPGILLLVDDLLHTGAQFVAASNCIISSYTNVKVVGIFWARQVSFTPDTSFPSALQI